MNYKEQLNHLYLESKGVPKLWTQDRGFFTKETGDPMIEFLDTLERYSRKFGIGKYLSKKKWGIGKIDDIADSLKKFFLKEKEKGVISVKRRTPLQAYDDIRRAIPETKNISNYDMARVARTETANMRALAQLLEYKKAGLIYATSKSKRDKKVAKFDRDMDGRSFKIDFLLKQPLIGKKRIPYHPNCRCWYIPSMKGIK